MTIEDQKVKFQKALEEYLNTLPPKSKPSRLAGTSSSEEVMELVNDTLRTYKNVPTIQENLRKFSAHVKKFDSWLQRMPKAFPYSEVVYGGIKILLEAAGRFQEVRERVMEVIALIPDTVGKAFYYTGLYPVQSFGPLQIHSEELYVAILSICDYVLDWLLKAPASMFTQIFLILIIIEES